MLRKSGLILISFILLCAVSNFIFAADTGVAQKPPLVMAAEQQLTVEKTHHAVLAHKLKSLLHEKSHVQEVQQETITSNMLHRADLAISLAQADLDGSTLTLNAAQQAVLLTQSNIDTLENQAKDLTTLFRASPQQQTQLQTQIENQRALLNLQQERVKVLQQTQSLAERALAMAQDAKTQLQAKYQTQQQALRQQNLDKLAASLQSEQQKWLTKITQLNQQLQHANVTNVANSAIYAQIETGIFEAEERSNLSQIQLDLARMHARFADLTAAPDQTLSLSVLNTTQRQINDLYDQLKDITSMLNDKITLLQKRIKIVMQGMQANTLDQSEAQNSLQSLYSLQTSYHKQFDEANQLQGQIRDYQIILTAQLSKQLASRQGLPGFDAQQWSFWGEKLLQIPALTWQTIHGLQKSLAEAILDAEFWQWILWLIALALWVFVGVKLHDYLALLIKKLSRRSNGTLANQGMIVCLKLLYEHLLGIMSLTGFVGLLILLGLSLQLFSVVIELGLVVLAFRLLISLARFSLLESTTHEEGNDVRLYYRLKWTLRIGGLITAITVLVEYLPIAYDIQDLFGRLFMLFLLVVALVLLRGWEVVPTLVQPYLERQQPYLRQLVRWLSLLVPLSILFNSLIGLWGYVELAWNIAAYQGLFLVVMTGYLLARGILAEIMKFFSEQVIRWSRNGWLWSEALLKPLHQVLKIILFLEALIILFKLYGWGSHSFVVTKIGEVLSFHLFVLAGSVIMPWNIIILLAVIAILVWAARWSREFAYRWLFANTKDHGLRNSLSIFTQYTIVVIGILIALRIAGINVTVLTVIASAFAFGMGWGLRDLANNFVSGLLLLIERPVRVGDFVTIGDLDGRVVHIGVRSITVTTDDHKELLVPNADVFSKIFMNWTHRDHIVRTLFTLHVNREDDPHRVRDIILQVLKNIPEIIHNPPPEAYFREMQDILLEFQIEYFLDLRKTATRWAVHSKVLFLLWDRFKMENIHSPEHPHEILLQGGLEVAAKNIVEKMQG